MHLGHTFVNNISTYNPHPWVITPMEEVGSKLVIYLFLLYYPPMWVLLRGINPMLLL